eukprot:scaffold36272_cov116-Isochrysis_galbana.AAC.3
MSRASPVKTALRVWSRKETQPSVWPGVARTWSLCRPYGIESPSSNKQSAWAPEAFEMYERTSGSRLLSSPVPVMWSAWQCVLSAFLRVSPSWAMAAMSRSTCSKTGSAETACVLSQGWRAAGHDWGWRGRRGAHR